MVDHSAVVSFIRGWTFQYEMEQQLTEEMQLFTQYMVDIKCVHLLLNKGKRWYKKMVYASLKSHKKAQPVCQMC